MFGLKPGNGLRASRTAAVMMWAVIATVCPVLVISCGYRFAGSGGPPRGIEKLYIALLDNKTTESGIDILTTNALKNEFIHKYRGVLVGRETATAILSGSVTGIRTETVSSRGSLTSLERRIYMTIDLALKSTASGQIWFARGITSSDTYTVVSGDKEASERNKRDVLQDLAGRIAEVSFHRLSDDF